MKKIISILSLFVCTLIASANIDVNSSDNVVYLQDANVQFGSSATLKVMLKSENAIGSVKVIFSLPEGVTIEGKPTSEGANVTWNSDEYILVLGKGEPYYTTGEIATLKINVASDVTVGAKDMKVTYYSITEPSLATYTNEGDDVVSTLTVQKTAVIEAQDAENNIEIIPVALAAGSTDNEIPLYLNNKSDASSVEAVLELPTGFSITIEDDEIKTGELDDDRLDYTKPAYAHYISIDATDDDQVYDFSISSKKATSKILPGSNNESPICNLYIDVDSSVEPGVYTIKLKNISISADEDYTGDYYFSVFVGEPITDAILYGHYTAEGKKAASALKGGSADITAATIDGDALALNDVLILAKDKTSYNRAVGSNYATICLPFALEGTYYTVSNISDKAITLAETSTVPANVPAITKGDIKVEADGYVPAETPVVGANGLTGTYEYIEKVTGYYLQENAFHNDYASVKPFRAYIPGTGAKCLSVYLETANGVIDITNELSNEDIYSLQGIKMNNTRKGINIVGGKKIYVK